MSVIRQNNWIGQGRADLPQLRSTDSSVAADFDVLAGNIISGQAPLIVYGFAVLTSGATGADAATLQISVANSLAMHYLASENGTIFNVPADRSIETLNASNPRLMGAFTANTVNFIGFDLRRSADASTADLVEFLDANTLLETPKRVPLARTLDYVLTISTQDFSLTPGICPIARVVTDANNRIVSIEDARNLFGRLGSGGSVPNEYNAFPWPGGRTEDPGNLLFTGGDKNIASLKQWMDAAMTRMWEIGGGEHWFSATADRNVTLARVGNTTFSNAEYFEWDGTNLHWRGIRYLFDNSTGYYNDIKDQLTSIAGLTNLAEGDCVYVDLDRTKNLDNTYPTLGDGPGLQPQKSSLVLLGTPTIPGSRHIIAWRSNNNIWTDNGTFPVNSAYAPATGDSTFGNGALGIVRLTARPQQDGGWPDNFTPEAVVADVSRRAVATGLTRGLVGANAAITAGAISVGNGVNDTRVILGGPATIQTATNVGSATVGNNLLNLAFGVPDTFISGSGASAFDNRIINVGPSVVLTTPAGLQLRSNQSVSIADSVSITGGSSGALRINANGHVVLGPSAVLSNAAGASLRVNSNAIAALAGAASITSAGGGILNLSANAGLFLGSTSLINNNSPNNLNINNNGIFAIAAGGQINATVGTLGLTSNGVIGVANVTLTNPPGIISTGIVGLGLHGVNGRAIGAGIGGNFTNADNSAFVPTTNFGSHVVSWTKPLAPALYAEDTTTGDNAVSLHVRGSNTGNGSNDGASVLIENASTGPSMIVRGNTDIHSSSVFYNEGIARVMLVRSYGEGTAAQFDSDSDSDDTVIIANDGNRRGLLVTNNGPYDGSSFRAALTTSNDATGALGGLAAFFSSSASNNARDADTVAVRGRINFVGDNPINFVSETTNRITPKNVVKAWCNGRYTNDSLSIQMFDGYNAALDFFFPSGAGSGIQVNFAVPFADTNYYASMMLPNIVGYFAYETTRDPSFIRYSIFRYTGAYAIDTYNLQFCFLAMGKQF